MKRNDSVNPAVRYFQFFVLIFFALTLFVSTTLAQEECEKILAEAEVKYQLGRLDEVIEQVNLCLKKNTLKITEREKCYLLLGKAFQAKSLLDSARKYIRQLLVMIPSWRPDPEKETPSFQKLAREVIENFEEERKLHPQPSELKRGTAKSRKKKWFWIAGGATLMAGTVAIIISRGDGGSERLPDPPDLPGK